MNLRASGPISPSPNEQPLLSRQGQAMIGLRSDEKVQTRKMTMNEKDKSWSVLAKAIGEVGLGAWTERDSPQRGLSFYVLHFAALYFPHFVLFCTRVLILATWCKLYSNLFCVLWWCPIDSASGGTHRINIQHIYSTFSFKICFKSQDFF